MTVGAVEQLRRVLEIIPLLATGSPRRLDDVARDAGLDAKAILKDLLAVSERLDDPGGFVPGFQIYIDQNREISVVPNHFRRPMRLVRRELGALELGLAMLRIERPPDEYLAIDGARERLGKALAELPPEAAAVTPPPDAVRVAAMPVAGDPVHLRLLQQAQSERRKVRLAYRKPAESVVSNRVICPHGVVGSAGMWYVVARCEESEEIRIFRLDRIAGVTLLDERFEPPDDGAVDAIVESGRAFQPTGGSMLRVRYSPRIARWVAEREGRSLAADGSLTLDHPLADIDWAARHVLQYGPDVEVLEPASVRDEIAARLSKLAD